MTVVRAPLFSFDASGAIAKALVYFPWKGLAVVRSYVVPANPMTAKQVTQRGYVTDAVADIHAAMASATAKLDVLDKTAYALWASTIQAAMTWFNMAVRNWVNQKVATKLGTTYRGGTITPTSGQITIVVSSDEIALTKILSGTFDYGTSKTALISTSAATIDTTNHTATKAITGLTNGVKYYIQFRPLTEAPYVGAKSGIYIGTPAA